MPNKPLLNLAQQTFGRLTALYLAERIGKHSHTQWACECACGNMAVVRTTQLRNGGTLSCGCLQKEKASPQFRTHGKTGTREHRIWGNMLDRCRNKNNPNYSGYGGRGIYVCQRWADSFQAFLDDMGLSDGLMIDRIDNSGPYAPWNCRWTTMSQQARNTRRNRILEWSGRKWLAIELAEHLGISDVKLRDRLTRFSVNESVARLTGNY